MTRASVTVVVNVYNEEPCFVAEALESVRQQTAPVEEIIVVEDGALRDYSAVYGAFPECRIIRQPNQGLAAARNAGLHAARGTWIAFLDGDDRLAPQMVAVNARMLAGHPDAVLAYGAYRIINRDGSARTDVHLGPIGSDPYATMLTGNCIGMHATVLYRRDELIRAGGFDASFRACEDYELYLRLARSGAFIQGHALLADYRYHGANMSGDRVMMLKTALRVLDAQAPHVGRNDVYIAALRRGRSGWKAYFSRMQLNALLEAIVARKPLGPSAKGTFYFLRNMPVTTVKEANVELLRRIRAALPGRRVDLGTLRQRTPVSRNFGYERGKPVDRIYIETFLASRASDVAGRVLEIGDNAYTMEFGGSQVEKSETLHVDPAAGATYCTDLTTGAGIPDGLFDCIVLTQTLHLVYDFKAAVQTLHRLLKPGGILLLTVPGVSSVDRGEWGETWYWSFTPASLTRLLADQFGGAAVDLTAYGNVLTATAFLYGLAATDLDPTDFVSHDPQYPVIVAARVTKAG